MYKFLIKGVVQGVGFRPYIYNEAVKLGLKGYVKNKGDCVEIVVDDKSKMENILENIPKLARIDSVEVFKVKCNCEEFRIKESKGEGFSEIPADLFICEDCLKDLRDKNNRRHNYYFTTCTNCGPRFSISLKSPYDRHTTSMKEFAMCEKCHAEYTSPKDRRYHAQTIACPECGPKLSMSIEKAVKLLKEGEVVAVKGMGGFHLVCTLKSIDKLRDLTKRKHKPYAIMCKDVKKAKSIAKISDIEEKLLVSKERPIVIVEKKENSRLKKVSELNSIGIMLPYTALHYLILDNFDEPLVMTSSNISDEPMTSEKEEQFVKHILDNERFIVNPIDDSLIKVINNKPLFIRRSRGFVPNSIKLKGDSVLAVGAEMNSCFAIQKDNRTILSQYLGTTSNEKTFGRYKKELNKFMEYTKVKPKTIVCDSHPSYNTAKLAKKLCNLYRSQLRKVQHHVAHAYSVAAEHNISDFVAIICDGLGYGEDNTIWGGEVFENDKRIGHLEIQSQLGGDSATKNPEKMLFSILSKFTNPEPYVSFDKKECEILSKQLKAKLNCPITTSCGRILDAASVLLGFCKERTYEGRPAMLLDSNSTEPYDIEPEVEGNVLLTTPLFKYLIQSLDKNKENKEKSRLAATVQLYLAKGLYEIAKKHNKPILFSGGCAYSRIMTSYMLKQGVKINKNVPAGDGDIAFGQLAYLAYSRNNVS